MFDVCTECDDYHSEDEIPPLQSCKERKEHHGDTDAVKNPKANEGVWIEDVGGDADDESVAKDSSSSSKIFFPTRCSAPREHEGNAD